MGSIFFEITIIVCLATILAIFFRFLKQPTILAYILTGIIIGPFGQLQMSNQDVLRTLGELGITFLLFTLGLELRFTLLKSVGRAALTIGIIQVVLTAILGFAIALLLGLSLTSSFYISIALALSSTVIVVSLLADRKNLRSLHGRLLTGLLLVQDFFAIMVLIFLSGIVPISEEAGLLPLTYSTILTKGIAVLGVLTFLSIKVFPRLVDVIAKSQETLFLFSIAWALIVSAIVSSIGFSIEIGGLLAGIALSNSTENLQIAAGVRSLRNFFIMIFFVTLGMQMNFANLNLIWPIIVVLAFFVILGKPLIITLIMGFLGYTRRTSFLTGIHAAQISEFSLIIVFLGNKLGFLPVNIVSIITGVSIITFIASAYMIFYDARLYNALNRYLFFVERKSTKKDLGNADSIPGDLKDHVVLIGANRTGSSILAELEEDGEKVLVVDFDPDIINFLKEKGTVSLFGDISDIDIQERALLNKAKLIISTVSDIEDNLLLLKGLRIRDKARIIVLAQDGRDAKILYKEGADYVVLPHLSGGRHVAKMIKEGMSQMKKFREKDMAYLTHSS